MPAHWLGNIEAQLFAFRSGGDSTPMEDSYQKCNMNDNFIECIRVSRENNRNILFSFDFSSVPSSAYRKRKRFRKPFRMCWYSPLCYPQATWTGRCFGVAGPRSARIACGMRACYSLLTRWTLRSSDESQTQIVFGSKRRALINTRGILLRYGLKWVEHLANAIYLRILETSEDLRIVFFFYSVTDNRAHQFRHSVQIQFEWFGVRRVFLAVRIFTRNTVLSIRFE